jgi:tryptophan synthase beta subunit
MAKAAFNQIHNLRKNYYNFNKNNKLSQSLENLLVVLGRKSPTTLAENFQTKIKDVCMYAIEKKRKNTHFI